MSESSVQKPKIPQRPPPPDYSEEEISSSSEDESGLEKEANAKTTSPDQGVSAEKEERDSPSPPPPAAVSIPPFGSAPSEDEQALKEKFRKFWMESIAEGFKDDLEELRKASRHKDSSTGA